MRTMIDFVSKGSRSYKYFQILVNYLFALHMLPLRKGSSFDRGFLEE